MEAVARKRSAGEIFAGIGAVVVGGLGLAFWASMTESQPALFLMMRQAQWGDGTYGPKETLLLTIFVLVSAAAVPIMLVAAARVAAASFVLGSRPRIPVGWLLRTMGTRLPGALFGAAVLAAWLGSAWLSFVAPEAMGRGLGVVGDFVLSVLAIGLPIALLALFDNVLPPRLVEGRVESRAEQRSEKPIYWLLVGGRRCEVPYATYASTRDGARIRFAESAFVGRTLAVEVG